MPRAFLAAVPETLVTSGKDLTTCGPNGLCVATCAASSSTSVTVASAEEAAHVDFSEAHSHSKGNFGHREAYDITKVYKPKTLGGVCCHDQEKSGSVEPISKAKPTTPRLLLGMK